MPAARMVAWNAACAGSSRIVTCVRGVIGGLKRVQGVRLSVAMAIQDRQRHRSALQRQGEQGYRQHKAFQPGRHGDYCIGIRRIRFSPLEDTVTRREFRDSADE